MAAFGYTDFLASSRAQSPEQQAKLSAEGQKELNERRIADDNWARGVEGVMMDLGSTNQEVFGLMREGLESPERMAIFQYFMQMRTQMAEFITNMMKVAHETARAIISNIRP